MTRVLITGGTGFVGQHLCKKLLEEGCEVAILSRRTGKISDSKISYYHWDVDKNKIDKDALSGCDYIIHLAGLNIGEKRWTKQRKEQILESRIKSAELILNNIDRQDNHLKAFISASAIGYYGSTTSDKIFNENDSFAEDFLGGTCNQWEQSADKFIDLGSRIVKIRTGIVLSDNGGALPRLSNPVRFRLGSAIGSGRQYLPWIHIEDLCNIYVRAIQNKNMKGSYNAVAPEHITNSEFIRKIAKRFHRSVWLPNIPSSMIKLIFGKMSVMLLRGSRVSSEKIESEGYKFSFPSVEAALQDLYK